MPASDLVVTSISWVPVTDIGEGEQVTFTATVKNISANPTPRDFDVRFEIDNVFIGLARITGDLPANAEQQATLTWKAKVGLHQVKAIADWGQEVTESNESNNQRIETLPAVKSPDLVITSLVWSPLDIKNGQTVTLTATLTNLGAGDSHTDFFVRFELGGGFLGRQLVSGLSVGQVKQVSQNWVAQPGTHSIRAVADEFNVVVESNEQNNDITDVLPEIIELFAIAGKVTLQARTDHAGTSVTFADTATTDISEVTTDQGGNYFIELTSGTYDVEASHPRFLSARKPDLAIGSGQPNSLAPVTLGGGDADEDGDTDSRDLLIIGRHFTTVDSASDLNDDGLVGILDLVLAASNFGKKETPWP